MNTLDIDYKQKYLKYKKKYLELKEDVSGGMKSKQKQIKIIEKENASIDMKSWFEENYNGGSWYIMNNYQLVLIPNVYEEEERSKYSKFFAERDNQKNIFKIKSDNRSGTWEVGHSANETSRYKGDELSNQKLCGSTKVTFKREVISDVDVYFYSDDCHFYSIIKTDYDEKKTNDFIVEKTDRSLVKKKVYNFNNIKSNLKKKIDSKCSGICNNIIIVQFNNYNGLLQRLAPV